MLHGVTINANMAYKRVHPRFVTSRAVPFPRARYSDPLLPPAGLCNACPPLTLPLACFLFG